MIRRTAHYLAVLAGLSLLSLGLGAPASAHVRIDEGQLPPKGGYGVVTLIAPSESTTATTVAVAITIPPGVDLLSARTLPVPGWTAAVETQPAGTSQRVARITWRADGDAGLKPSEFGEFTFSAGPWPDADTVALPTEQTYSDGTVSSWNEVAVDAASEPEHPAPVLTLGAETNAHGDGHGDTPAPATDPVVLTADGQPSGQSWVWRAASVVSLVVAAGSALALVLVLRRLRSAAP